MCCIITAKRAMSSGCSAIVNGRGSQSWLQNGRYDHRQVAWKMQENKNTQVLQWTCVLSVFILQRRRVERQPVHWCKASSDNDWHQQLWHVSLYVSLPSTSQKLKLFAHSILHFLPYASARNHAWEIMKCNVSKDQLLLLITAFDVPGSVFVLKSSLLVHLENTLVEILKKTLVMK